MIKVGLTGGIGSGKSVIAKVFRSLGVPVFNADLEARELVTTNSEVKQKITDLLGEKAFKEGEYDRSYVASVVFQHKDLLEKLNQIIHPAALNAFDEWVKKHNTPYIIKEAAILFESGSYKSLDKVITVSAPTPIRIQRVIDRDKITEAQVMGRIAAQYSDEERKELSDFEIINDDIIAVLPQILKIHEQLNNPS
jgi:dephospho-CoA kinase